MGDNLRGDRYRNKDAQQGTADLEDTGGHGTGRSMVHAGSSSAGKQGHGNVRRAGPRMYARERRSRQTPGGATRVQLGM